MPILKPITTPNGAAVAFHKAVQANYDPVAGTVAVNVASWADEDTHNAGGGLVWMWPMDMAPSALTNLDAALAMVVPFDGGSVVSDESLSLAAVQLRQCAALDAAYAQAITGSVSFTTAAAATHSYQSDPDSVAKLSACLLGWMGVQTVPAGFYWLAADNTRVSFTYGDLQGLAAAFINAGHAAFALLQDLKVSVRSAATSDAAKAIAWPH
jgi:hypothetical protein